MSVEFKDFSMQVKAALNDTTKAWLNTWANEIAAQAKDNTQMDGDVGVELRKSYKADVNDGAGEAKIGTPLEAGFWEEYGTGAYAAHGDGRKGWWVYIEGQESGKGGKAYATKEEAEEAAAFLRSEKKLKACVTNGRKPAYTLEKAFTAVKPKAEADLEKRLKGL